MPSDAPNPMPEWPLFVQIAADASGLRGPEGQKGIELFAQRWGGFGPDALARAVREAKGDERLFAIRLSGHSRRPEARLILLPLLDSAAPEERWMGAAYLGELQEPRALLVLCDMLTQGLPAPERYLELRRAMEPGEEARCNAAFVLGASGDPGYAPCLRNALQAMLHIEHAQQLIPYASSDDVHRWAEDVMRRLRAGEPATADPNPDAEALRMQAAVRSIHAYQDELVYALGRLGALGALTGLADADRHLEQWRVHLVMGYVHGRFPITSSSLFDDHPELAQEVERLLRQRFGLGPEECERALARYSVAKGFDIALLYYALEESYTKDT